MSASRARSLFAAKAAEHFETPTHRHKRLATIDELTGGVRSNTTIGPFGSSLKTSDYRTTGVPLIFVRSVRSASFSRDLRFVSPEKARELGAHLAVPGDLLVTKMGDPPGDAAVYTGDQAGIVTADVIRLRPSADFDSRYLAFAFNSRMVRRQIAEITSGVAQKKVSLARFRAHIRVPVCDLVRQREVVVELDEARATTARLLGAVDRASEGSKALSRRLLVDAFSGRLTSRNELLSEEPANG